MHHQFYDGEEEFEPRITPKPIAKLDYFAVPTVPEVSLIFEKSSAQTSNKNSSNSLSGRSSENIAKHSSISPVSYNSNSYATWRKQNHLGETNSTSTTHGSPSYKNAYNCSHALHSNFQDVPMQAKQRQDKICDVQKESNTRVNDRIYEKNTQLKCSDINNSPNFEEDLSHFTNRHLSRNSLQKGPCDVPDYTKRPSGGSVLDNLQKIEHLPCIGYQQFSTPSSNIDSNETVRTLLQLVNNQSEQIKTLQLQVDRLVRMQEETFRNKSTCLCSQSLANQVFRCPTINHYDTAISSSIAQSQNQGMKKPMGLQSTSVTEKKVLDSFNKEGNSETALMEQQSKKAFMEQKVSIGVMTSFEFTVENNPFLVDADKYEKKEVENNMDGRNAIHLRDTTEPVMRYKNTFTCRPGAAQLENIVEVAESNMSSSQQQSSNFNTSSVRDSERHISKQSDLYIMANAPESSKMYQCHASDLTKRKIPEEVYTGKSNTIDEVKNADRMLNASMNVNRSPVESANCSKALGLSDLPYYVAIDKEKRNDKMNAHENASQNYLPMTDYYQNYREREHNVKQSKDIGDSMTLSESDLRVVQRPPPTPQPSIHVEMQEYSSDDESDSVKRTPKIGWTLYNNVLGQVNEILQNSGAMDDKDENNARATSKGEQELDREAKTAVNTVKVTTLEQLRKLGISLTENEHKEANANKSLDYDSSFYPRLDCQANLIQTTSIVNETNTSMHMKALALKYLNDEQLADIALHKQESLKHLMVSNMQGTNLSFATMRYLERYQLIPGKNNIQIEDQMYGETASKHDFKLASEKDNPALRRRSLAQTSGTACPSRILDLSALKKQPKLL